VDSVYKGAVLKEMRSNKVKEDEVHMVGQQFVSGERVRVRVRMAASSRAGHLARVLHGICMRTICNIPNLNYHNDLTVAILPS
jgi:hypothetical protein